MSAAVELEPSVTISAAAALKINMYRMKHEMNLQIQSNVSTQEMHIACTAPAWRKKQLKVHLE